jgi:hypothetical protein
VTLTSPRPSARLAGRTTADGKRLYWWAELLAILSFYVVYSFVRNASRSGSGVAYLHARQLMHWERLVGMYHEVQIEHWALHFRPLVIAMNYLYGSLHFVVTAGVLIFLFRHRTDDYPRWRNTLAATTLFALVGFVLWPLMPPRLLPSSYHFVDTLARYPTFWSFDSGAMSKVSNQYAAMPSLHFGWSMFCATALAPRVPAGARRIAVMCYPLLTLIAIVLTANHYFLDAAGGLVVFAAGYSLARWWEHHRPRPAVPA